MRRCNRTGGDAAGFIRLAGCAAADGSGGDGALDARKKTSVKSEVIGVY